MRWPIALLVAAALAQLAACAGSHPGGTPHPSRNGMPAGPGILSGKSGAFTVYSR